jgi:hypothetical protein
MDFAKPRSFLLLVNSEIKFFKGRELSDSVLYFLDTSKNKTFDVIEGLFLLVAEGGFEPSTCRV